jgi:hypothetical protein
MKKKEKKKKGNTKNNFLKFILKQTFQPGPPSWGGGGASAQDMKVQGAENLSEK